MAATADAAFGAFAKESLDQIEPTGAGGSEVNLVAGMPGNVSGISGLKAATPALPDDVIFCKTSRDAA